MPENRSPAPGDARSPRWLGQFREVARSYEIRIKGVVGDSMLESLGDLDASVRPAQTVLRGVITDQAELHGLLDRIQSLGLELIEIRQVTEPGGSPG